MGAEGTEQSYGKEVEKEKRPTSALLYGRNINRCVAFSNFRFVLHG